MSLVLLLTLGAELVGPCSAPAPIVTHVAPVARTWMTTIPSRRPPKTNRAETGRTDGGDPQPDDSDDEDDPDDPDDPDDDET